MVFFIWFHVKIPRSGSRKYRVHIMISRFELAVFTHSRAKWKKITITQEIWNHVFTLASDQIHVFTQEKLRFHVSIKIYCSPRSMTSAGIKYDIGRTEAFGPLSVRFPRPLVRPLVQLARLLSRIEAETNWTPFRRRHFQMKFLKWKYLIPIKISLKFVPKFRINNIPALVQTRAWCRSGDKPLSEPIMFSLLTHICVTRSQWVNARFTPISWGTWDWLMLGLHRTTTNLGPIYELKKIWISWTREQSLNFHSQITS